MKGDQPGRSPGSGAEAGTGAGVIELSRSALLILSGAQRGEEHLIEGPRFRIGKAATSDLVLDDETVSRAHCEIVPEGRGLLLRDLASTNGTLLDGAEIKEAWIKPGAVLTVGAVELKVRPFSERVEVPPIDEPRLGSMIGPSREMRQLFGLARHVSRSERAVLIVGEPGAGKSALARTIHEVSPRAAAPLVEIECGALHAAALERELFGAAAARSGATPPGAFERARGGTVVLRHVDEAPSEVQASLLSALEQRALRRPGAARALAGDARVLATSRRDLHELADRGALLRGLATELSRLVLEVPPLRRRSEDIAALAEGFLEREAASGDAPPMTLRPDAAAALATHDWPHNVRELLHVVAAGVARARAAGSGLIGALPVLGPAEDAAGPGFEPGVSYRDTKTAWDAEFERRYVAWLLERSGGNMSAAARAADMDRKYLYKLARRHGLHPRRSS